AEQPVAHLILNLLRDESGRQIRNGLFDSHPHCAFVVCPSGGGSLREPFGCELYCTLLQLFAGSNVAPLSLVRSNERYLASGRDPFASSNLSEIRREGLGKVISLQGVRMSSLNSALNG